MHGGVLSGPKLTKELLSQFSTGILQCQGAADASPLITPFLTTLCHYLALDLHPDCYLDQEFTLTPYGKAVSPTTAAQCAEDIERSRLFMQAVYQAVQERLTPQRPVRLLYAGTGPLGWLVLPMLGQFTAQQVQITALDIHPASLDSFRAICQAFGLEDHISAWICADATIWQPQQEHSYDIVLSETMNQFLEQEPQIQIFVNLQRCLAAGGSLIPQQVLLSAEVDWQHGQHKLGQIFCLNLQNARALAQGQTGLLTTSLSLPDQEPCLADIKLCTEIQIYKQIWLFQGQSQLTIPKYRRQLWLKPGSDLTFAYQFCSLSKWQLHFQYEPVSLAASTDLTVEGIYHLYRLWQKTLLKKLKQPIVLPEDEWFLDRAVLDLTGIGLQPGMQMLYQSDRLSRLQQHIRQLQLTAAQKQQINQQLMALSAGQQTAAIPAVLSPQQLAFWQQHGYLVIPAVLTPEQCEQSRAAIWQYLQASPEQPDSWYQHQVKSEKIMLPLFRHPALDANREVPLIRQVFQQLWQRTDLVMSTDRVSFNPPQTASWKFPGPDMHWDMPLRAPVSFATQGLIYLTDTTEQQGAFCCVPGFHLQIEQWLLQQSQDEIALQQQNWAQWPVKAIAAKAGDLIIWHHALPHGPCPNTADTPRMVQYINMYPLTTQ